MNPIARFMRKLSILFRQERFASELDEEMTFHRTQVEEELIAGGMTPEAAHYAAMRQFGNASKLREQSHEVVAFRAETVVQDLRFALRQWTKNPGFASTAILILALGMGVSVAICGFVDAALLQPLPYANPERLMSVNESNVESPRWPLSYPDYLDWQRLNKSFSSLDVYSGSGYLLRTPSGALPVQGERVSGGFFKTLGVRPMLGRDFYPGENRPAGANVVLLSYGAWLRRFGGRRDVIGQTVDLDNASYTIIGVLPRTFTFAPSGNAEFWTPLNSFSTHEKMRTFYNFWGIGRLRDGVSVRGAAAETSAIAKQLQLQYGITGRTLSASIVPLYEVIVGDVRPILLTLLGGAGLLLLIACVNVASLVLVRSENRRREIAVRGALGATPARLVCQFVTESLLLAGFGSLTGALVAAGLMKLFARLVPKDMAANMPFLGGVALNAHTGAVTAAIALMAALLLAATPTLRLSFQKVRDGLAEGDRGHASRLWQRLGANMVIVELVVAVVLLAGAGLLGQSLYQLLHVPLGFDPNRLATVQVMASDRVYKSDEQTAGLRQEIARRVSSLPGVESVGLTSMLPVQCNCQIDSIQIQGRPSHGEHNDVDERHISPGYLPTLKARLVRGRLFTDADDASRPGVAMINQALARKFFPGEDPIGQRITDDEGGRPSAWEIVGVVDDVREGPLDVDIWPAEYFPINQTHDGYFSVVVRTRQDPVALLPLLASTLHQFDTNLGVSDEDTMSEQIDGTQAALLHRSSAWLVGGFAAVALVLGVVGLYGVIAYWVSRRTREIGVRMALGAQRSSVYSLVLRQAGWLTGTGLSIGMVCSVGASLLIRNLLFGVQAWDPVTLCCVAALLGLASMAASFLPARRAASVNPTDALRAE
ncbi:MAG: ABC transporter permease [Acidobacteria bacterium]|nr:MAG: ABC transporter permease [Acidobacteriota bacterium]